VFLWHFLQKIFGFQLFRWFLTPFQNCGFLCSCMLNLWDVGLLASKYWKILKYSTWLDSPFVQILQKIVQSFPAFTLFFNNLFRIVIDPNNFRRNQRLDVRIWTLDNFDDLQNCFLNFAAFLLFLCDLLPVWRIHENFDCFIDFSLPFGFVSFLFKCPEEDKNKSSKLTT
jgi:hypothetical protein